jgi:small neutral amino acid transporter SnatA (MarC family)
MFFVGLEMLRAQTPDEQIAEWALEDSKAAEEKKGDIAITPLGVPFIGGACVIKIPNAQQARASTWFELLGGLGTVVFVVWVFYLRLAMSSHSTKWLSPTVLKLSYRLSGLILADLAIEMFVNGIKSDDLGLWPKQSQIAAIGKIWQSESACS